MDRKAGALRRQRLAAQVTLALLVIVLAPLAWAHAQSAPAPAAPSGSTEVPELRTATSKTFKHTDGRLTKRLYAEPVHYREGGRWKDIDSSLVPTAPAEHGQGYAWRTKSNGFGVLLKPRLEPDYMRFDISRQSFSFGLAGARPVPARTNGPRVEYPGALPGVDVRYEMRPEGVKEELVLRDANAASKLHFTIDAPERLRTAATRRDDGSVELFAGGRGKPSFVLTPPFATDAAKGNKRAGAATRRLSRDAARHVSMSVDQVGGRYEVELAIDEDWLRDPKRRFPVTVDPSITVQPTAKSAEFTATCPGCSGYDWGSVDLGTDDVDAYRGAFQFDLSDIPPGAGRPVRRQVPPARRPSHHELVDRQHADAQPALRRDAADLVHTARRRRQSVDDVGRHAHRAGVDERHPAQLRLHGQARDRAAQCRRPRGAGRHVGRRRPRPAPAPRRHLHRRRRPLLQARDAAWQRRGPALVALRRLDRERVRQLRGAPLGHVRLHAVGEHARRDDHGRRHDLLP
jgi:hypothetical protein